MSTTPTTRVAPPHCSTCQPSLCLLPGLALPRLCTCSARWAGIGTNRPCGILRSAQRLVLHDLTVAEADRMAVLMEKYSDTPMDLADASLVAVAESRKLRRVFTVDSDFHIYRLSDGSALDVIR
jgi:hypothetical protein